MGSSNIWRLLQAAWLNGAEPFRLSSTQNLTIRPVADDTGDVRFGDGTTDMDVRFYVGATTDFALFDVGNGQLTLDSMELNMGDSDEIEFGDATDGDARIRWDGTDLDLLFAADDSVFKIGDGTQSADVWIYGNIATSYLLWDASADQLQLRGPVRPRGFNSCPRRYELQWRAGPDGLPQINTALALAPGLADRNFMMIGVNSANTSAIYGAEGGIVLVTAAADGDEAILAPHSDAGQTPWRSVTWGTDREVEWDCHIATNANITNEIIFAGLKLTGVEPVATDDDQIFFRYEDDIASGVWQIISSRSGVDTTTNTSITVTVNTEYHLKLVFDSSRVAQCYINGALVNTTAALDNAGTNLIPFIGVALDGASAAKRISVFGQAISRVPEWAA